MYVADIISFNLQYLITLESREFQIFPKVTSLGLRRLSWKVQVDHHSQTFNNAEGTFREFWKRKTDALVIVVWFCFSVRVKSFTHHFFSQKSLGRYKDFSTNVYKKNAKTCRSPLKHFPDLKFNMGVSFNHSIITEFPTNAFLPIKKQLQMYLL